MCGLNPKLLWYWMLRLLLLLTLVFHGFLIPTVCDNFICYLLTMRNSITLILRLISLDMLG